MCDFVLKQQLTVVKSSLGVLNETLSHMVYNEDRFREGLTKLQHYVDSVVSQAHNVTNFLFKNYSGELCCQGP